MFSWSTRRKLFYLSIFFAFVFFVVALPSFFLVYRAPSCFDGIQNQGEAGIDCGGPCARLCPAQTLPPLVLWQRAFEVAPGVYNAVASVENPNFNSAVTAAPYVFRLYDADNTLIVERTGTTYIPPRKTFYVFEGVVLTGNRIPIRTTFEFVDPLVWHAAPPENLSLQISGQEVSDASSSPKLTAIIKNGGVGAVRNIQVVAVVSDGSDNAFAASKTAIDMLGGGASLPLTFTWREPWGSSTPATIDFGIEVLPAGQ